MTRQDIEIGDRIRFDKTVTRLVTHITDDDKIGVACYEAEHAFYGYFTINELMEYGYTVEKAGRQ